MYLNLHGLPGWHKMGTRKSYGKWRCDDHTIHVYQLCAPRSKQGCIPLHYLCFMNLIFYKTFYFTKPLIQWDVSFHETSYHVNLKLHETWQLKELSAAKRFVFMLNVQTGSSFYIKPCNSCSPLFYEASLFYLKIVSLLERLKILCQFFLLTRCHIYSLL